MACRIASLAVCVLALVACRSDDARHELRIDTDTFGWLRDNDTSHETILMSGTFDTKAGVAALGRAGERFMLVDEEGTEYRTEEQLEAGTLGRPRQLYSPNYVSEPRVTADGIELYVDCKGVIPPPMAARFRRILREELTRARIADASVRNAPINRSR